MTKRATIVTIAADSILMITMGARQSLGLFVSPLNTATGLGITTISFAYAVAQLMWGVAQPFAGGIADRYGPSRVLMGGLVVLAIGMALTPFARWRPAHAHARIFDTHFYLARLPAGAPEAEVDATENVRLFWASAQDVLDDADAGRARIIFPTRRNLERLARHASFAAAIADAARYPVRTVTPWIEQRDDGRYVCIDDDLGYPVTAERFEQAMRV